MKTRFFIVALFCLGLISTTAFAQSNNIDGNYKITGYFDDGTAYSGTMHVTSTDKGISVKGAVKQYLKQTIIPKTNGCISYFSSSSLMFITFCDNGDVSITNLKVVRKNGATEESKRINEVTVKRM